MASSAASSSQRQTQFVENWRKRMPGVLFSLAVAVVAYYLGNAVPLVGGPVFGIILGLVISSVRQPAATFKPGLQFTGKLVLQFAIVLMGFTLSMGQVVKTGSDSLVVMLSTLTVALVGAAVLGRLWGVKGNLTPLIGAGTGICGASAIAAVSGVINAEEREIAYSISTVFAFNVIAVLIFPPLGHLLGFSQKAFGLWAGTAINDTSSVVAAAYTYGQAAGDYATIVKLSRATMIIPIALGLAAWRSFRNRSAAKVSIMKLIPWFIVWFLVASIVRSVGLVPNTLATVYLPWFAKFFIIMALTAIGLGSDIRSIAKSGWRPLALGASLWVLVAMTSILMQRLTGQG